jgi:ABC-type transporter Mla subunit MlaD
MSAIARNPLRLLVPLGFGVVVVVGLAIVLGSGAGAGRTLYVSVDDATGVTKGQRIRMAGKPVGQVADIKPASRGRAARIELRFDDTAWPLARGSRMRLRWGGTISYLKRYIAVTRGPDGAPAYGDGATLPAASFSVPVEFDSLIDEFTPKTRRDLKAFINRGGVAVQHAEPQLRATVRHAPPAVQQASGLLAALDRSDVRLDALVGSTADVVDAIRSADPSVEQAVTGAARTLSATAQSASALRATLHAAPGTFGRIRGTLANADRTLDLASSVTTSLRPGVAELRRTIAPLNRLLTNVVRVGPDARATLATARRASPDLTKLLDRGTSVMPQLESVAKQAIPELDCIRPYTPEIAALTTNWAGFISSTDGRDHYVRINPAAIPWAPTNVQAETSGQAAKLFPGMRMGLPRPPGWAAGQPWFQPQCGAGPEAIDPQQDPEARPGQSFSIPQLTAKPRSGARG